MFQTVGLVARVDRKKALDLAVKLLRYTEKKGLTVFMEPVSAKSGCNSSFVRSRKDSYRRLKGGCFFLEEKGYEA